jgi:hypothetical protein
VKSRKTSNVVSKRIRDIVKRMIVSIDDFNEEEITNVISDDNTPNQERSPSETFPEATIQEPGHGESSAQTEENDADEEAGQMIDAGVIPDWRMSLEIYELLRTKLPKWYEGYKVIVDLESGHLAIRIVPGDMHGVASSAFNYAINLWCNNNQPLPPGTESPLINLLDASASPFFSLTDANRLCLLKYE